MCENHCSRDMWDQNKGKYGTLRKAAVDYDTRKKQF